MRRGVAIICFAAAAFFLGAQVHISASWATLLFWACLTGYWAITLTDPDRRTEWALFLKRRDQRRAAARRRQDVLNEYDRRWK